VTCMDTRLIKLLPHALNLHEGDAKIIKNAGAIITHPFGGIMRSVIVALYELNADEVFVIGHHDCGMSKINPTQTLEKMVKAGISENTINTLEYAGINLGRWLHGFDSVSESVRNSVSVIRNHPLVASRVPVHGLIIDPETGRLDLVVDGNAPSHGTVGTYKPDIGSAGSSARSSPFLGTTSGGSSHSPVLSGSTGLTILEPGLTLLEPPAVHNHHHHHHHHHSCSDAAAVGTPEADDKAPAAEGGCCKCDVAALERHAESVAAGASKKPAGVVAASEPAGHKPAPKRASTSGDGSYYTMFSTS